MEELLNKLTKDVNEMTREEFEELPERKWDEEIGSFDSLVIIPLEELHDSGYRCMSFVACNRSLAVCKMGGGSDVIHVDGIGGMGQWGLLKFHKSGKLPVLPDNWSIDCLKVSGYLRIFPGQPFGLKAGSDLSSFEIFSVPPDFIGPI